jgi:hypothetical protein
MISILQHLIPIGLGFIAKLTAIKSEQAHQQHQMMLQALAAKEGAIQKAREHASTEGKMAAWNRRILMFAILSLVAVYPLAGVLGIDTVVKIVEEPTSFLFGIFEIGGETKFETIKGLYKFDEIFTWATMIVEFYFGGQLAKGK